MTTQYCQNCGANLSHIVHQRRFCPSCGQSCDVTMQQHTTYVEIRGCRGPYNKWITFLLWLFLGFLGAHKFYEGKIFVGIIYALTAGLLGIGLFFDFFAIIFKPREYYL